MNVKYILQKLLLTHHFELKYELLLQLRPPEQILKMSVQTLNSGQQASAADLGTTSKQSPAQAASGCLCVLQHVN